jgi:hypothetical protein
VVDIVVIVVDIIVEGDPKESKEGTRVQSLHCGVYGMGCGVYGMGCGVYGMGCGVYGMGCGRRSVAVEVRLVE